MRQGLSSPVSPLKQQPIEVLWARFVKLHAVENFLKGKTVSPQLTAQAMALANSAPLKYNAEKIDMAKGLLVSGLEKLAMA